MMHFCGGILVYQLTMLRQYKAVFGRCVRVSQRVDLVNPCHDLDLRTPSQHVFKLKFYFAAGNIQPTSYISRPYSTCPIHLLGRAAISQSHVHTRQTAYFGHQIIQHHLTRPYPYTPSPYNAFHFKLSARTPTIATSIQNARHFLGAWKNIIEPVKFSRKSSEIPI